MFVFPVLILISSLPQLLFDYFNLCFFSHTCLFFILCFPSISQPYHHSSILYTLPPFISILLFPYPYIHQFSDVLSSYFIYFSALQVVSYVSFIHQFHILSLPFYDIPNFSLSLFSTLVFFTFFSPFVTPQSLLLYPQISYSFSLISQVLIISVSPFLPPQFLYLLIPLNLPFLSPSLGNQSSLSNQGRKVNFKHNFTLSRPSVLALPHSLMQYFSFLALRGSTASDRKFTRKPKLKQCLKKKKT